MLIITLVSALCVTNLYAQPQLTLEQKSQAMKANASNWNVSKDVFDNVTTYTQKTSGLTEGKSYCSFRKDSNGNLSNFCFCWRETSSDVHLKAKSVRFLIDGKDISSFVVFSTDQTLVWDSVLKKYDRVCTVGVILSECKELANAFYNHDNENDKGIKAPNRIVVRVYYEDGHTENTIYFKNQLDNLKSAMEFYTALGGEWTTSETAETIKEQEK